MNDSPGGLPSEGKPKSSLTEKTTGGLAWALAGAGTQALLKIIVLMVLARLLTPTEFGLSAAAMIVITFAQIFGELGVLPAIVQRDQITDRHLRAGFASAVTLGLVFGLLVYSSSDIIEALFAIEGLSPLVAVLALILPISGLGQVSEALIQRNMRFKHLAAIDAASYGFGYGAVSIIFALLGFGVWALVIGQIAQVTFRTLAVLAIQRHPIGLRVSPSAFLNLARFGGGFAASQIANTGAYQIDNFVVGRWMGAEALGIYGRAFQALTMPTKLVGAAMLKVLFPAMASVQHERERLARAFLRATGAISMLCFPLTAFMVVYAREIVLVLLGAQWDAVVLPFQILSISIVFRVGHKICDALVRAKGAVYRLALRQWAYVGAVFLGAYVGQHWGLPGVAAGVALAVALNYFLMLQLAVKLAGVGWGEITLVYARHVGLSAAMTVPLVGCAIWTRSMDMPALLSLALGGALLALFLLVVVRFAVGLLGEDGQFLITTLRNRTKRKRK